MIQFSGDMSVECKRYIAKHEAHAMMFGAMITIAVFLPPTVYLAVACFKGIALFLVVYAMMIVMSLIPPSEKACDANLVPLKITIANGIITTQGRKYQISTSIEHVKQVVDMVGWYHIFFYSPYRCQRYVCEKRLLVSGTIEEFEKLFVGKIIRLDPARKRHHHYH